MLLSCYRKLVSPIKKIQISSDSPLLKHIISFRRFVYIVVQDAAKCISCGKVRHIIKNWKSMEGTEGNDDSVVPGSFRQLSLTSWG